MFVKNGPQISKEDLMALRINPVIGRERAPYESLEKSFEYTKENKNLKSCKVTIGKPYRSHVKGVQVESTTRPPEN